MVILCLFRMTNVGNGEIMKIYEIGTGYTSIPASVSAATEIIVEELTKKMLTKRLDVEIIDICDLNRKETSLPIIEVTIPKLFLNNDVHLGILHKLKRVAYSIALARKLKKILKRTQVQVVLHFHNQYNLFFFLKLLPNSLREKCTIAYTNHSGIWRMEWDSIKKTIHKRYFMEATCMKKADIVFSLNRETKENIIKHLDVEEDRIICIENGVNMDIYKPLSEAEITDIKRKYHLQDKRIILQVGSIYENKGQLRSLEYLLPMLKRNADLIYVYAGGIVSKEYHQKVIDYAKKEGIEKQVKYLGMVNPGKQLNEVYNIAVASILPSEIEAFGLVVIEAMAAGIPVLVDANAPFSFGKGCIPYTLDNFIQVVDENLLENSASYEQHCVDARKNAVDNYSWDRIVSAYVDNWNVYSYQEVNKDIRG